MPTETFQNDYHFSGDVSFGGDVVLPDGVIGDSEIEVGAAIDYLKLGHLHRALHAQAGTVATATTPLGVVVGATGTVKSVRVGTIVPCAGAATITVDIKKNGTTVLSSVVTLNSANTARVAVSGGLSGGAVALVAGDFLEAVVTATAGGGTVGTGLLVEVRWAEDAA
jgi:hypothetical protein